MSYRPYRFAPASTAISLDAPVEKDNTMPSSKLPPRARQWLAILATAVLALTATASLAPSTLAATLPPTAEGAIARDGIAFGPMGAEADEPSGLDGVNEVDGVNQGATAPVRGVISAGQDYTCALKVDGSVECWGVNSDGQADGKPGPFTHVGAGDNHTCAVKTDQSVECWGNNLSNQVSPVPPGPYTQVSAGDNHSCALKADGSVECWGSNFLGRAEGKPGPFSQVSTGGWHNCAVKTDGSVECWGDNDDNQVSPVPPGPYTEVSAGFKHSCALKADGSVECWGENSGGQAVGKPGPYTQVSVGNLHSCALKADGSVECWGANSDGRADGKPGPYTEVSAGHNHTCALKADGSAECWGANSDGQADNKPGPFGPSTPSVDAGFALGREWAIPGDLRNTRSFFATFNAGSSVDLLDILFKPAWYSRFGDPKAFGQSPLSLNTPLPGFGHSIVDTNAQLGLNGSTIGDYSVFISSRNHDTASVAWHHWGQAEAAVGQVPPSADVTVPMVLNGWVGQYSKVYIQNADANTYLDLNVEVYQQGSATPAFSKPWGKISQKDAIMIDMRQLGLPSNFLGTMKLKSMSGATLNAETMVFQEGNDRAVYAFEGVPADAASARLIAPLFRRGFYGDTGISVANPNPGPVVVTVVYFGSNTPGNSCAGKAFSHGPYTIAANSGAVFYQGLGSERLPTGSNGLPAGCFGSAEIVASDNVMAIVNDAQTQGRTTVSAGAVVAQPWESASDLLNLPLVVEGDAPTGGGYTAGIQLTNTDLAPAQVVLQFHKQDGSDIRCPGSTCSFTVGGNSSYNYYLGGNVLPDPVVFASARLFADKPMIASVTIVRPGFDQSFYNAIAATTR